MNAGSCQWPKSVNAYEYHADGIRQVQDYLGDACPAFFFRGARVQILPGTLLNRKGVTLGGFQLQSDLAFTVLAEDLPADLVLKDIITYLDQPFRVDSIGRAAGDTLARFECNNPTQ